MITGGGRKPRGRARSVLSRDGAAHATALSTDRNQALALTPVSCETLARLDRFVAVLVAWQRRINLIAPSTEAKIWTRHIADSLQLLALAPQARLWADLGSGAGFPGLVIACALAEEPSAQVHLVESSGRKAAFLRDAIRATGAPAIVHAMRAEEFIAAAAKQAEPIDVVTARALAPLAELLALTYPLLKKGVLGLFPKGQDVAAELTHATKCWKTQTSLALSRTDPKARIVVVRGLEPKLRPAREA